MEQFHTDRLSVEHWNEMFRCDPVLGDEPLEYMKSLWGDDVHPSILERDRTGIASALDQPSLHKVLTDPFRHISRHAERRRRCRRHDLSRVFGVGRTTGLGELEVSEVGRCLVAGGGPKEVSTSSSGSRGE
jgi:hypothetical protein